jgi:hypothetical protein
MGYPLLQYEESFGKTKPSLLCIGDSFFWPIYDDISINKLFTNLQFWYYNKQAYPEDVPIEELNVIEELNKYDIIMILGTNATLPNLGWGVIE